MTRFLNAFTTGNPCSGTNLLGDSIGRDLGGSKGVIAPKPSECLTLFLALQGGCFFSGMADRMADRMALSRVRNTAQKKNGGTPLSMVASHLIHILDG